MNPEEARRIRGLLETAQPRRWHDVWIDVLHNTPWLHAPAPQEPALTTAKAFVRGLIAEKRHTEAQAFAVAVQGMLDAEARAQR